MKSYLPLIRSEWRLLLFGFVMMFCSSPGQTYFIALFSGQIRQDLALSHGEFGAIYSTATLMSAVLLLWTGSLLDRIDLRKFALVVVACLGLACIFVSMAQNMFMLMLAILALRQFGQGLMSMTSSTTMVRYLSATKGKANSLAAMGFSAAEALLPSLVILALITFSWRQTWLIVALVLLICAPLLVVYSLNEFQSKHQSYLAKLNQENSSNSAVGTTLTSQRQWTRSEVIRDPLFYLFIPGLVSQSMLYTGFMFHQIHLVEEKAWSLTLWASLYLLFSVTSIVSSLSIGALADKVGAVKLAPFITLPMAIGLMVLSSSDSSLVAVVYMVLMGLSTGGQAALATPFFAERYGNKHFGSIKSLGTFSMVLMSAISPVVLGWFIDRGASMDSLAQSFALYALLVIALASLAYRLSLRERHH